MASLPSLSPRSPKAPPAGTTQTFSSPTLSPRSLPPPSSPKNIGQGQSPQPTPSLFEVFLASNSSPPVSLTLPEGLGSRNASRRNSGSTTTSIANQFSSLGSGASKERELKSSQSEINLSEVSEKVGKSSQDGFALPSIAGYRPSPRGVEAAMWSAASLDDASSASQETAAATTTTTTTTSTTTSTTTNTTSTTSTIGVCGSTHTELTVTPSTAGKNVKTMAPAGLSPHTAVAFGRVHSIGSRKENREGIVSAAAAVAGVPILETPFATADLHGDIFEWNDTFVALCGLTAQDMGLTLPDQSSPGGAGSSGGGAAASSSGGFGSNRSPSSSPHGSVRTHPGGSVPKRNVMSLTSFVTADLLFQAASALSSMSQGETWTAPLATNISLANANSSSKNSAPFKGLEVVVVAVNQQLQQQQQQYHQSGSTHHHHHHHLHPLHSLSLKSEPIKRGDGVAGGRDSARPKPTHLSISLRHVGGAAVVAPPKSIIRESSVASTSGMEVMTILVVDDSATTLKMVANTLRRDGHTVDVASSAAEALSVLQSDIGYYDIVIVDIFMPEMSGLQMCSAFRRFEKEYLSEMRHQMSASSSVNGRTDTAGDENDVTCEEPSVSSTNVPSAWETTTTTATATATATTTGTARLSGSTSTTRSTSLQDLFPWPGDGDGDGDASNGQSAERVISGGQFSLSFVSPSVSSSASSFNSLMLDPNRQVLISFTENFTNTIIHEVMAAGFDGFMAKPFSLKKFNEVIKGLTAHSDTY